MARARLTRREEFEAVLANGRHKSSRNFIVRACANPGGFARLGLIASRKAAPRAVDRNRGKRIARELIQGLHGELPSVDIVIQLRSDLRKLTNDAMREELRKLLEAILVGRSLGDGTGSR